MAVLYNYTNQRANYKISSAIFLCGSELPFQQRVGEWAAQNSPIFSVWLGD